MAILLVGAGGTGGEVLKIIKNKMKDSPHRDSVAYYLLDSKATAGVGFDPGEFRHIGGFRVSSMVRAHKDSIRDWWFPENYEPEFDTREGAGQTRLTGRLCMFLHGDEILNEIRNILTTRLQGNFVDVIVVGSSGGGTGAGIVTDIGYLLKDNLASRHAKFMCVLLDPTIVRDRLSSDDKAKMQSELNGLGCLTELEYYMAKESDYSFKILKEGSVVEVPCSGRRPYDSVVILQTENTEGFNMSSKEDYFHLAAEGIWTLIHVSLAELGGAQGGTGIENKFNALWNASHTDGKSQFYASFGCATIEFPFSKVHAYCGNRYAKGVISRLLRDIPQDEEKAIHEETEANILRWNVKESDNSDNLIKMSRNLLWQVNNKWAETNDKLSGTLANRLMGADMNVQAVLESEEKALKKDIESLVKKGLVEALGTKKQEIVQDISSKTQGLMQEGKWKHVLQTLIELEQRLKAELDDLIRNEDEEWLRKRSAEVIEADLRRLLSEIMALYHPTLLQKIFRRGLTEEEIKVKKTNLARKWVEEFFTFSLFEAILPVLRRFYAEIISIITQQGKEISDLVHTFSDYADHLSASGILNTRVDVPGHKAGVDFIFEVCSSQEFVDNMIYPSFNEEALTADLLSLSGQKQPGTEQFKKIVEARVSNVLKEITLDKALELEADYFWSVRRTSLKNTFETGTHKQKEELLNDLQSVFGLDALRQLRREIEAAASGKGAAVYKPKALNSLIEGRISRLLNWAKPFWNYYSKVPGLSEPFRFSIYYLNRRNEVTADILKKLNPVIQNKAETTGYDLDDPCKALFFQLQGIQPLFNLSGLSALRQRDEDRRSLFRTAQHISAITSPDQIGYADRKFVFERPYNMFSIYPSNKEDRALLNFAMAETFGYIKTGSLKARRNFELVKDLGIKYGRTGQILGLGLDDSISYLKANREVLDELERVCIEEFNMSKIKDKPGLVSNVAAQLGIYLYFKDQYSGKKASARATPVGEIYDALYEALWNFALEQGLVLEGVTKTVPQGKQRTGKAETTEGIEHKDPSAKGRKKRRKDA
jgi:Tubulin like